MSSGLSSSFRGFIKNVDVTTGSPNYYYNKPNISDVSYCNFMWNKPNSILTHEIAFIIQQIRNQIEGNPIYHGLMGDDQQFLQYRVCNSVSPGQIVYPHGDFIEQERRDPAADHKFDPKRIQATLALSTHKQDYDGDGFIFTTNQGIKVNLGDIGVEAGDLVLWRYGNIHEVKNIIVGDGQSGFLRIIYPTFDLSTRKKDNAESYKYLGKVGQRDVFTKERELT